MIARSPQAHGLAAAERALSLSPARSLAAAASTSSFSILLPRIPFSSSSPFPAIEQRHVGDAIAHKRTLGDRAVAVRRRRVNRIEIERLAMVHRLTRCSLLGRLPADAQIVVGTNSDRRAPHMEEYRRTRLFGGEGRGQGLGPWRVLSLYRKTRQRGRAKRCLPRGQSVQTLQR